jgi:hypothetical protein
MMVEKTIRQRKGYGEKGNYLKYEIILALLA